LGYWTRRHWETEHESKDFGNPENVNVGIATATPAADILKVLRSKEIMEERKKKERELIEKNAPRLDGLIYFPENRFFK
jgi:hypothetical protein